MHIGKIIKETRVKKNIPLREVAEIAGISRQSISAYEQGQNEMNSKALLKIIVFLGVEKEVLSLFQENQASHCQETINIKG